MPRPNSLQIELTTRQLATIQAALVFWKENFLDSEQSGADHPELDQFFSDDVMGLDYFECGQLVESLKLRRQLNGYANQG